MTEQTPLRIVYLTSGAAGMYCGSCLHDNTLVRALREQGADAMLVPTYTPIRTDEEDVSTERVFFGGVSVYLKQKLPWLRFVPKALTNWLDNRWLLEWATSRGMKTDARDLGALTVSMLQGEHGRQRQEVAQLCDWLAAGPKPDIINLSNMLIAGCLPRLKEQLRVPLLVTLQGDDIFLDSLPEPFQSQAIAEIRRLVPFVDGFIVNSRFYAELMGERFAIPPAKIHVIPLGIDTKDFVTPGTTSGPWNIGYLARLAPEKGLHVLVDAFVELRQRSEMNSAKLRIAGWLGESNQAYADEQFNKLRRAGLTNDFEYVGTVTREEKVRFLQSLALFTVPTTYREPKGLFALEAMAAGVPVVLPDHGAFPEMLESTGGGQIVPPNNPAALANTLGELLASQDKRTAFSQQGRNAVLRHRDAPAMALSALKLFRHFTTGQQEST